MRITIEMIYNEIRETKDLVSKHCGQIRVNKYMATVALTLVLFALTVILRELII